MSMKISGDCENPCPQSLPCASRSKNFKPREELEYNRSRLVEMRKEMKYMKDRIGQFVEILQKEVGDEAQAKDLLRHGSASGWQGRAQMILTLRMKLMALRSKFLDPPHKMYYKGPFDPQKEFSLKFLPEKQNSLYEKMLAEKKKRLLQLDQPVSVLQKEFDDLFLMHRASRFRTKSLLLSVKNATKRVENAKEKAALDLRVIEAMMAHQSLFKMMIDPETFLLDPTLKRHAKVDPSQPPEIAEWKTSKMAYDKAQKENGALRESLFSLTAKLDEMNRNLVESERVDVQNRLSIVAPVRDKGKERVPAEDEYDILVHENRCLRSFLINSVLMFGESFELFVTSIDAVKQEFISALENVSFIKENS